MSVTTEVRVSVIRALVTALLTPVLFAQVTDEMLLHPSPDDWLMYRRTLGSWGHGPLDQINRSNVRSLQMVWSRALEPGIQERTPLVHNGVMFMPNPADVTQAIDAAKGRLLWQYKRPWPDDVRKIFPVPEINRNLAIYGDTILDTSNDGFVYALDRTTGKLKWETRTADYRQHSAQNTSGPIVANGKIFSGRGCEPRGGPDACVVIAHDAKTGRELWRRRTIPGPGEPGD